jgi:aminoglycoside 3-N-acetyltransferase
MSRFTIRLMFSRESLSADFRRLGVQAGDLVMLHASIRSVGRLVGGPDQIHLALKEVLTGSGTLVMYASCPEFYDEVGRGNLTVEEEQVVLAHLPAFDPYADRSQRDNGALVELFRTSGGVLVNAHVARFAAWGRLARHLIAPQPWNYAFGRGSLLERFVEADGKILLLGSDHDAVTFLHYTEHVVDIPDKRIARFKVPVLEDGSRVWRDMEEFDTSTGVHRNWPERFFAEIVDGYLERSGNHGGRVGHADSYLFSARGLHEYALPVMQRIAVGPVRS